MESQSFQRRNTLVGQTVTLLVVVVVLLDKSGAAPTNTNVTEADFYKLVPVIYGLERHTRASTAPYGYRAGQAKRTNSCQHVRAVPSELRLSTNMKPKGLENFYQKYTEAYGIPVLSSSAVPDDALRRACYTLRFLLASHSQVRQSVYSLYGRVAVIGKDEDTTDIPEHSNLEDWWNQRARGLGATPHGPTSSGGEENVLCYTKDRYPHQDIFLHETAHAVHLIGAAFAITGWDARLRSLYNQAKTVTGLWNNTYSMSTAEEYFAEGTMSYFNVNVYSATANGVKGPISTRDALRGYDPQLYALIKEVFPCDNTFLKRCHSDRAKEDGQILKMDCDVAGSGTTTTNGGDSCVDDNKYCSSWAASGECTKSSEYMSLHCKQSCSMCSTAVCKDDHTSCTAWASIGECSKNSAYMHVNCKKSCKICGSALGATSLCTDNNKDCGYWAGNGECTGSNKAYMISNCKKSCRLC